jgi:hypothetical protein
MATKVPDTEKLGASNYTTWAQDVLAWLGTQQLKRLVLGKQLAPSPADPNRLTADEKAAVEAWEDKSEKAAGRIITLIKPDQRVHIKGMEDNPVKMWERLETVHVVKQAGARFDSYDSFFSIRKKEDESLVALTTRSDGAMQTIQSLRPNTFTLQTLDKELFCMA